MLWLAQTRFLPVSVCTSIFFRSTKVSDYSVFGLGLYICSEQLDEDKYTGYLDKPFCTVKSNVSRKIPH